MTGLRKSPRRSVNGTVATESRFMRRRAMGCSTLGAATPHTTFIQPPFMLSRSTACLRAGSAFGRFTGAVPLAICLLPAPGRDDARASLRSLSRAPWLPPSASRCAVPSSAPLDASSDRRVTRPCTMLRVSASATAPIPAQSARHCLAHSAPQCPPLTRRGGSDPPGSPASIFPISRTA